MFVYMLNKFSSKNILFFKDLVGNKDTASSTCTADKLVRVCCALTNLSPSIVPQD